MKLTTIEGASNMLVALSTSTVYTAGTLIETAADLTAEGDLVLLNESNKVVTSATSAASTKVRFCAKRKGTLRYSDWVTKGNMNFYSGKGYVAPTYKLSYIGYNGTSGTMDAANATEYKIRVIDNTDERLFPTKEMYQLGFWKSTAATQENVATGLFNSLVGNTKYGESFVDIALLNSGSGSAIASGNVVKVSKGSNTIIVTHASAALNPTVGKYLRFGGTATTLPVYKVKSVSGTATNRIVVLESPYLGATANLANTAVASIATTGANYGLKLLAVQRSSFKPGVVSNLIFDFELGITGFTTATVTNSAYSTAGSGTYRQMAELEWYQEGHAGTVHRDAGMLDYFTVELMTASGATYEQLNMGFYDNDHFTAIGQDPKSMKMLTIACATPTTSAKAADIAIKAMDAFAASSNGFAASGI